MRRGRLIGFVLVLCAAAALAHVRAALADRDLVVRSFRTATPSRIPLVEVTSRGGSRDGPVAFLVHGFQCNRAMMMTLAKRLARNGVDAYALDLPGHGASLERFSERAAGEATREALAAVIAARAIARERIVLIGHSYGASVLARVAAGDLPRATAVMLGPSYAGGVSENAPGNLLVLTAERDPVHITAAARQMLRDGSAGAVEAPRVQFGALARGDARAWEVIPDADHLSLLLDARAANEAAGWLDRSLGTSEARGTGTPTTPPLGRALLVIAAGAAVAVLALGAWTRAPVQDERRPRGVARVAIASAAGIALGAVAAPHVPPLPLRLLEGEQIASILVWTGLAANALALLVRRGTPLPSGAEIARGLVPALAAFAIVYVAATAALDADLYRVALGDIAPERHAVAIVAAAALFPFFGLAEGLADEVRRAIGGARGGAAAFATAALLGLALAAALPLVDARLGRFAVAVAALALFCAVIGGTLTRVSRNPAVGAIFSAAVSGWVIAVGFVRY